MAQEPFDIARIVPSVRDLHAALMTQKKSLGLVPCVKGDTALADAAAYDAIDVRAFAMMAAGSTMQDVARSTSSMPMLLLQPCTNVDDCLRARYFGSDGVCIQAATEADWTTLAGRCRSMRMMPIVLAENSQHLAQAVAWGVRAAFLKGPVEEVVAMAENHRRLWLAAHIPQAREEELASLVGKVDAAVVGPGDVLTGQLETWLDTFDA